jgi:hypothetical protein
MKKLWTVHSLTKSNSCHLALLSMTKPKSLYRVTSKGKKELQRLINELEKQGLVSTRRQQGKKTWPRQWFADRMPLDRETVTKIVRLADPSTEQFDYGDSLEQDSWAKFFVMLQALVAHPQQARTSTRLLGLILNEIDLLSKTQRLISAEYRFWAVPESQNEIVNRSEPVATMLRTLDYGGQQFEFSEALKESSGFAALLIPAPCARSQLWAIDRLSHSINNQGRIMRIPLFNVSKDPIRSRGVDELWKQLAIKMSVEQRDQASRDKIKEKLSRTKRPVLIALYNFGEEDITPREVIKDFWEPLTEGTMKPSRNMRSQVVLLIADCRADSYHIDGIKPLKALQTIAQSDIKDWFAEDIVDAWVRNELGQAKRQELEELSAAAAEWNCSPGKVLDKICFNLGLNNGAEDLQRRWQWS